MKKLVLVPLCLSLLSCISRETYYTADDKLIYTELIKGPSFSLLTKMHDEEEQNVLSTAFVFQGLRYSILLKDFSIKINPVFNSLKDSSLSIFYTSNEESILFGETFFNKFKPIKLTAERNSFFIQFPYTKSLEESSFQLEGFFDVVNINGQLTRYSFKKKLNKTNKLIYTAPPK
jgi:hypothetical protein